MGFMNMWFALIVLVILLLVFTNAFSTIKTMLYPDYKPNKEDFKPYEPEIVGDEDIVQNSIKALVLAINTVAAGDLKSQDALLSEYKKKPNEKLKIKEYEIKYKIYFNEDLQGMLDAGSRDERLEWISSGKISLPASSILMPMNVKPNDGYNNRFARIESTPIVIGIGIDVWYEKWPESNAAIKNEGSLGRCSFESELREYQDDGSGTPFVERQVTKNREMTSQEFKRDEPNSGLQTWSGDIGDTEKCAETATKVSSCPGIELRHCGWSHNKAGIDQKSVDMEGKSRGDKYFDAKGNARATIKSQVAFSDSLQAKETQISGGNAGAGVRELDAGTARLLQKGTLKGKYGSVSTECTDKDCWVLGFEMPQGGLSDKLDIYNWITGAKDPKYILYYEAFPQGEEVSWQVSTFSFFNDVLMYGAALNSAFPLVGLLGKGVFKTMDAAVEGTKGLLAGKSLQQLRRENLEEEVKAIAKAAGIKAEQKLITEVVDFYTKKGYETYVKSAIIYDNLIAKGFPEYLASNVQKEMLQRAKLLDRTFGYNLGTKLKSGQMAHQSLADDIIKKNKDALLPKDESLIRSELKGIAETSLSANLVRSFESRQALKKFFGRHILDSSGKLSPDLFKQVLTKTTTKEFYEKLPAEALEELNVQAARYADELWDPATANIAWHRILGSYQFEKYGIPNFEKYIDTAFTASLSDNLPDVLKTLALGNKPYVFPIVIHRGNTITGRIPSIYLNNILTRGAEISLRSGAKTTSAAAQDAYNLFVRSAVGRYSAAIVIGHILAEADTMNEKWIAKGADKLILAQPFMFDKSAVYDLETQGYYINLWKGDKDNSRFYLASPCKADIQVYKNKIKCQIENGDYVIENIIQPVEKNSIDTENLEVEPYYLLDTFDAKKKESALESILVKGNGNYPGYTQYLTPMLVNDTAFAIFLDEFIEVVDEVAKHADYVKKESLRHQYTDFTISPERHAERGLLYPKGQNYDLFLRLLSTSYSVSGLGSPKYFVSGLGSELNKYISGKMDTDAKASLKEFIRNGAITEFSGENEMSKEGYHLFFRTMYSIHKDYAMLFKKSFDLQNGPFYLAAKKYYFHYFKIVDKDYSKISKAVKKCETSSNLGTDEGILNTDINLLRARYNEVEAVTVSPMPGNYEDYNDGLNYCYYGDHDVVNALKYLSMGAAIGIDIAVASTGYGLIAQSGVAMVTGGLSAYLNNKLDDSTRWPKYQNIKK